LLTTTSFLPFDKGDNGAAGNPVNPFGFATHYLWEEVWQRDSWLEILGRYLSDTTYASLAQVAHPGKHEHLNTLRPQTMRNPCSEG
jgi:hypothetical protein